MHILSFPLEIIDDGTGIEKEANLAQCSCGGDVFYVIMTTDHHATAQIHLHLQCAQCEQTYCQINTCNLQRLEEVTHG